MIECEKCGQDLTEFLDFDYICDIQKCPKCGQRFEVEYDESYDEDSGDECGWFYITYIHENV